MTEAIQEASAIRRERDNRDAALLMAVNLPRKQHNWWCRWRGRLCVRRVRKAVDFESFGPVSCVSTFVEQSDCVKRST